MCPESVLILIPVITSHICIYLFVCPLVIFFPSGHHFIDLIPSPIFHYLITYKFFKLYIPILPFYPPATIYYFYSLIFIISIYLTRSPNLISGKTPKLVSIIFALLNLVRKQYDLSNITFSKLALFKLVFYNNDAVISALGILTWDKLKPENNGLKRLTAVIAADALFYIDLFVLVYNTIFIIIW